MGREPTDEEVARRLGWTVKEIRDVKGVMADASSLDQPVSSEDSASELGDFIEDECASDTPGEVIGEMESARLKEIIERLPERHRHVLIRRYGLGDSEVTTLAALSEELGISRERVRQVQREAERILKAGRYGLGPRTEL
jgi:RNA polymerase primary sigma factor